MEGISREELTERSNTLKVELKVWEREFAAANNGTKASREDIKNNPEIGKELISSSPRLSIDVGFSCKVQRIQ
jgi:hypothetical protein